MAGRDRNSIRDRREAPQMTDQDERLKPLETPYDGHRFRSRREARWAVFFKKAGIPAQYEEQGYDLGAAGWYLPDFHVNRGTPAEHFFEVKGVAPTPGELAKAEALCEQSKLPVYVYYADVRLPADAGLCGMTEQTYREGIFQECERILARDWLERATLGGAPLGEVTLRRVWTDELKPTAIRAFTRNGHGLSTPALPLWQTDCPHCDLVVPKLYGQVGWCPAVGEADLAEPLYPNFRHATKRLQDAYAAARSERFGR
jgi:hypothetical protein